MIQELFAAGVAVAEARGAEAEAALLPEEEEALVGRAVEKRRRELALGRTCARRALAQLGLPPVPILRGPDREPLWPDELVGSITHCDGYCAAAVAPRSRFASLGLDAELDRPLPDGVLERVAFGAERARLRELPGGTSWDCVLFGAKESVFKAWFPLTGRWLDFDEASLQLDPRAGTFRARLLVPGPTVGGRPLEGFDGRFLVRGGLVLTALAVPCGAG